MYIAIAVLTLIVVVAVKVYNHVRYVRWLESEVVRLEGLRELADYYWTNQISPEYIDKDTYQLKFDI